MALGDTPVPYHTGGRGAVRTLDKGFHRVVRRCSIRRFVSLGIGDSALARVEPAREVLRRFERALNAGQTPPIPPSDPPPANYMQVVPGTVNVRARATVTDAERLQGLQESFIPEVWKVEEVSAGFPIPQEFPPASGPNGELFVGPDGHVQVFEVGSFITFALGALVTRFILGYVAKAGAGILRITVTRADGSTLTENVPCGAGPFGPRVRVVVSTGSPITSVKVERFDTDPALSKIPRVLAYHFDLNDAEDQLMHCNCARGGSSAAQWATAFSTVDVPLPGGGIVKVGRASLWWRLLATLRPDNTVDPPLPNDPVGVDMALVSVGEGDLPVDPVGLPNVRFGLRAVVKDHATAWPLVDDVVPDWPPGALQPYSYPPLVVYILKHDNSNVARPNYFERSVAFETATTLGQFYDDNDPAVSWGPLPVDVIDFQRLKTQPGVYAPDAPGNPNQYVDPRRFTIDGAHLSALGAAHTADLIARLLAFPELEIGAYDLTPFYPPDPPDGEGRCPSATTYNGPPSAPLEGGAAPGEGSLPDEGATSGEGGAGADGGWGVGDFGLPLGEGA